jgi:translation initiation factor IF-2
MSDTKSTDDKTLGVNKKTLTLKRPGVEQSTVRQNFSHGRTKSVVVETKKRKFSLPDQKPEVAPPIAAAPTPCAPASCTAAKRCCCTGAASGGSRRVGTSAPNERASRCACPATSRPTAISSFGPAPERSFRYGA